MLYESDYQGRRAVKDEGGAGRIYFWDEVIGEVIWEFPLEAPASQDVLRFFFNGRLVAESDARPGAGFHYMHRDHLGTSKLMTEPFSPTVACNEVYHPFGQVQSEQPSGCNAHVRKFTGKERDSESGMDYFGARYSDSHVGRFMSPDPLGESALVLDPQSWNRYTYTLNNPLKYTRSGQSGRPTALLPPGPYGRAKQSAACSRPRRAASLATARWAFRPTFSASTQSALRISPAQLQHAAPLSSDPATGAVRRERLRKAGRL